MSGIQLPVTVTGADNAAAQLGKVSKGLGDMKNATNQANTSLTNLSRVVQDAPFGFIGIANNINPLVESFGRLKAETGSIGGAFKALSGQLLGAGGIGLAVAAVTSALTVLSQSGFFKAGEAADDSKKKLKEFQKQVDSIQSSVASEQANILILVKALEDETTGREKKAAALKQLQQINPQYFGDLKLEGDLVKNVGQAYQAYAANILASVQNKIDTKRLEDVLTRLNEAQAIQERNQLNIKANEAEINRLRALGGGQYASTLEGLNKQLAQTDKLSALERQRDEILAKIAARQFEGVVKFGKDGQDAKKKVKDVETISDVITKLREKLAVLSKEEITFNVDKSKDKIKALEETISTLFSKFKLQPTSSLVEQLKSEIDAINQQIIRNENLQIVLQTALDLQRDRKSLIDKVAEESEKGLAGKVKPIKLPAIVTFDKFSDFAKRAQDFADGASDIVKTALVDSFSAIGEGLGNIITGNGGIGNIFASLYEILGQSLKQLGKFVIASSNLVAGISKALNAAFKGNPILGVLAGIALIALGTVIQNTIPKFANGVTNFGGGVALVGERGPELVRLPSGSDVIPNYRLNSMSASSPMAYIPDVTLRGSDLVIAFNRQTATNRRNG